MLSTSSTQSRVEKPKIIKQTMQKPVTQEKINQETEHTKIPAESVHR